MKILDAHEISHVKWSKTKNSKSNAFSSFITLVRLKHYRHIQFENIFAAIQIDWFLFRLPQTFKMDYIYDQLNWQVWKAIKEGFSKLFNRIWETVCGKRSANVHKTLVKQKSAKNWRTKAKINWYLAFHSSYRPKCFHSLNLFGLLLVLFLTDAINCFSWNDSVELKHNCVGKTRVTVSNSIRLSFTFYGI